LIESLLAPVYFRALFDVAPLPAARCPRRASLRSSIGRSTATAFRPGPPT
jgi:hypothetical protein